jgi:hypothetical protein
LYGEQVEPHEMAYEKVQIGALSSEPLRTDGLFWLAVGCIPMTDGRVSSLENVQSLSDADLDPDDYDLGATQIGYHPLEPNPFSPMVHFDDNDIHASNPQAERSNPFSPTVYVHPDEGRASSKSSTTPRKFRFAATDERVESLDMVAEAVGADT